MEIKLLENSMCNCYEFNYKDKNYLIDPGFENVNLLEKQTIWKWINIDTIIYTHWHFDHISSIEEIINLFPEAQIYINKNEYIFLLDSSYNLSKHFWKDYNLKSEYKDRIIKIADWENIDWIKITGTPWHTIWSTCFYFENEKICFTWDTLFSNTHWRTDLKTWDQISIENSLELLFRLPWDTMIYPWHGSSELLSKIEIN